MCKRKDRENEIGKEDTEQAKVRERVQQSDLPVYELPVVEKHETTLQFIKHEKLDTNALNMQDASWKAFR